MICAVEQATNCHEQQQDALELEGKLRDEAAKQAASAERARVLQNAGDDSYDFLRVLMIDTKQRDDSACEGMWIALQGVLALAAKPAFSPLDAFNVMTRAQGALLTYADESGAIEARMNGG